MAVVELDKTGQSLTVIPVTYVGCFLLKAFGIVAVGVRTELYAWNAES